MMALRVELIKSPCSGRRNLPKVRYQSSILRALEISVKLKQRNDLARTAKTMVTASAASAPESCCLRRFGMKALRYCFPPKLSERFAQGRLPGPYEQRSDDDGCDPRDCLCPAVHAVRLSLRTEPAAILPGVEVGLGLLFAALRARRVPDVGHRFFCQ